jgi:uncharacterized repeat protein (TIGR03803 family)
MQEKSMRHFLVPRLLATPVVAIMLAAAPSAHATDTYGPAPYELQIPSIGFGSATLSDVELTILWPLVSAPNGIQPVGTEDRYQPDVNQLTVPSVLVGSSTHYNAIATVHTLTSIGGVSGADTFDGTDLLVRNVQVNGGLPYHDVTLRIGLANLVRIGGGMPTVAYDQYDTLTGLLTVAAVQVGDNVYTNVVLRIGLGNVVSVAGYTERVLYAFANGPDGAQPQGGLIMDASGNLFGTTSTGGNGQGTVFELSPSGGGYNETVLYRFSCATSNCPTDGSNPVGNLVLDAGGNLYGTTEYGVGSAGNGTVYKLAPNGSGGYTESLLYVFQGGTDAGQPLAGLIMDIHGNLYGTTFHGGAHDYGTVYRLAPNGSGGYAYTVLYSFQGNPDAAYPYARLVMDANGNLFGTTPQGGTSHTGTLFELAAVGDGSYTESLVHSFSGCDTDGCMPFGALAMDTRGNLFGTTSTGGTGNIGTLFRFAANPGGGFTESVFSLSLGIVGASVATGLIVDAGGNLYGVGPGGTDNVGDVVKFMPNGQGGYTESILYSLRGRPDGGDPETTLILDPSGNLYGTTYAGGADTSCESCAGFGVVFEVH